MIIHPFIIQIKQKSVIILLLLAVIAPGCKLSYNDISPGVYSDTSGEIEEFSQNDYGYIIYDISAAKVIKSHNSNKEFIPASVTKIFTALFAAETLGYDYTFSTTLSYNGKISENILTGNLYIKGTGDPELTLENLQSLANSIKLKKINELNGHFYFDESFFTPREMTDENMPEDAYYNAGISPLSFNSNVIYAIKEKNSEGKIISAKMLPQVPSSSSFIYTESLPYPFIRFSYDSGRERWGFPDKNLWENRQPLPVKHPGVFTAWTLHKLCEIHGIKLPPPEKGTAEKSAKIISVNISRPLDAIIKNMLFTSNNITAELIYTVASEEYFKKNKQMNNMDNAMKNFFSRNFTGVNWNSFRIINASGLTDLNRVTPSQAVTVLLFIEKNCKDNFTLEEILPLSGWEGTMKNRLDLPDTAFRVYSKTGSIFYASALAGVFYGKSGKRYIFTVFINDNNKRSVYNTKMDKSSEDLNQAGLWTKKAASSIDKFIVRMINEL